MLDHNHDRAIRTALISLSVNPDLVRWHYIQAAFDECDGNVSQTARRLGMHRRTLQRILQSKPPLARPVQHG